MTQEEKQLLLKDLCARIPYRTLVQLNPGAYNKPEKCLLCGVDGEKVYLNVDSDPFRIDHIKPYLRPMSSMTVEEETLFRCELPTIAKTDAQLVAMRMELFLKGHLDFNHLIEKGLALEALEGIYKEETKK